MSTVQSAQTPSSTANDGGDTAIGWSSVSRRARFRPVRLLALAGLVALVAVFALPVTQLDRIRRTHSITDDVFVELTSSTLRRKSFLVGGSDMSLMKTTSVGNGQIVAEIDPTPYLRQGQYIAGSTRCRPWPSWHGSVPTSSGSATAPTRSKSPRARRRLRSYRARAEESLKLARDEVEKSIDEARAGAEGGTSLADIGRLEYPGFTRLEQQGASTLQRQQQMTQSRDSALVQFDLPPPKLAKALASRTQIDVARGRSRPHKSRN